MNSASRSASPGFRARMNPDTTAVSSTESLQLVGCKVSGVNAVIGTGAHPLDVFLFFSFSFFLFSLWFIYILMI